MVNYTMEYYSVIKKKKRKKKNLPFAKVWTDQKNIMLNEISQSERQRSYDFIHMWNLMNKVNKQNRDS